VRTLIVGDEFIPAPAYLDAFAERATDGEVDLRTVALPGAKAEQHALQQIMEVRGANAVEPPAEVLSELAGVEAICVHFAPVGRALIDTAPDLRIIAVARAGLENIDVEAASARGIVVVPAFGRNAGAVAELQIGLMLAEARNIARADASVKQGGWRKEFPGARIEIAGRTVGMVGFGHVGRVFAQRLAGFAPRLLAYDPYTEEEAFRQHGVERAASLDQVFADSDFVVVQARHSPETDRFIGARQFALMKPTAYFINVSRSRVVDTQALLDVLRSGSISGAGLDVFDDEPLPADSEFRALDNLTVTTHFGGDTADTNRTSANLVASAVLEFVRTGRVATAVNADAVGSA
jgi:D-3-phosphoglycerate dehydrogenase